jgi:TolA-binding protein
LGESASGSTDFRAATRAALLALLQRIESDTLPRLGAAFLALEKGDTAAATAGFAAVASTLPPEKGGAELRLWAGRLEVARGHTAEAERLFRAADVETAAATAPAAELELGRLLIAVGRRDEAVATLEHLILTYSTSALVPQARRLLDEARGAVPRT